MDCYLQPRPLEELREAAAQLTAFWRAEAPRHAQEPRSAFASTCHGALEESCVQLATVGSLLQAAVRQPGGPDERWFQAVATYLELSKDLPVRAFASIAASERVLSTGGADGPDLFTWRHAVSMLAAFTLKALSWALLHEAAAACSRHALPPRLLAAMLRGEHGAHAVEYLCNNLCAVLRSTIPRMGAAAMRGNDPLRDPTLCLALRITATAAGRAVGSLAFAATLALDEVGPAAQGLAERGIGFPDLTRLMETCVVFSQALRLNGVAGGPDVVGDGALPLMVAAFYQPHHEHTQEACFNSSEPMSACIALMEAMEYFNAHSGEVREAASPWSHPRLQPCIDALRALAAWPLGGGLTVPIIGGGAGPGANLQAMVRFQERLWQAAGRRPQSLPIQALKQLADGCSAATDAISMYTRDSLATWKRKNKELVAEFSVVDALARTLTLTLRCVVVCLDQQAEQRCGGSGAAGSGAAGSGAAGSSAAGSGGGRQPPALVSPEVGSRVLYLSALYLLQSAAKGVRTFLELLTGADVSLMRMLRGRDREGQQQQQSPQQQRGAAAGAAGQQAAGQPSSLGLARPGPEYAAAVFPALLEVTLRLGAGLCSARWGALRVLSDSVLHETSADPEFTNLFAESGLKTLDQYLAVCLLSLQHTGWMLLAGALEPDWCGNGGAASASSSDGGGSSDGNGPVLALPALQGIANSLAKAAGVWIANPPGFVGKCTVANSMAVALHRCLDLLQGRFGGGKGGGTRGRDLANTCFRLQRLATALAALACEFDDDDDDCGSFADDCLRQLEALGVRDGMAADRAGVGCCYVGCDNLGGWEEAGLHLSRCGGCRNVRYCSSKCQRADWRSHKEACKAAAAAAANNNGEGGK